MSSHENSAPGPGAWRFRADVEGLRAVAIIGVVLFHAGIRAVPGGFLGVDVFFVLSGFLITGILIAEAERTGRISLSGFWARRIRRLLPAAMLVSGVTLVLSAWFDSPLAEKAYARSAIAFATYWSNLLYVRRGADYFNHTVTSDPFLHTWSLAVEEQYYLVFAPLCLLFALTFRGRTDGFRRRFFSWVAAVSVASFAACLWLTSARPLLSFYGLPSRAWEFGVGGMLTCLPTTKRSGSSDSAEWAAFAALIALVGVWFIVGEQFPHPGWITLVPVLATAGLVYLGTGQTTRVGRVLELPVMRKLGRLSYSWYLWHWPVTIYWDRLFGKTGVPLLIGMPVLSLMLAQATYVVVEAPARQARWLQSARRSLLVAPALALSVISVSLVNTRLSSRRVHDPSLAYILGAVDRRTVLDTKGCHLGIGDAVPRDCVFGQPNSDMVVVLFGDSHAAQWFPALESVALQRGWRLVPMTKSSCPSLDLSVWIDALKRAYLECDRWRAQVFARLAVLKPALVIMSNYSWYQPADSGPPGTAGPKPISETLWQRGLAESVRHLPAESAILLLQDTPRPGFDVPTCLLEHVYEPRRCEFPRDRALARMHAAAIHAIQAAFSRVSYADLNDFICDTLICQAARRDTMLYADQNHLTSNFAASLAPHLLAFLPGEVGAKQSLSNTRP
ncbi:MAG TPA: acyltransferase family protein [Gemmatimonadaceae bacterium]|nr:acyltransferase family protein [Gemmatimonadaceae bacterium]